MIISHKYKFIFIKTRKTAGTSLEVFLSQYCGSDDILTPIYPHVDPHLPRNYQGMWNPIRELIENKNYGFRRTLGELRRGKRFYNHIPGPVLKNRIAAKVWNEYFKFCVERNPWDKTLSHYHMLNARAQESLSFDAYLAGDFFCLNYPLYTDLNGRLIVDKVIKYETLNKDLCETFEQLKIPFNGTLEPQAKSDYRKDRQPYQEVFSPSQQKRIGEIFAIEIALHGYQL